MSSVSERLKECATKVEAAFDKFVPAQTTRPTAVHEAMNYSLRAGGKRLRPALLLAAFEVFPSSNDPLPAAVAIECLHTYSLIHDDLPCMDNSDLRRGQATCHKKFGETIALLAGDALLTHSLTLLADAYKNTPELATVLVSELGNAASSQKLIGGQVEDTIGELGEASAERLDYIHENKTAALITASIVMGFLLGNAPKEAIEVARKAGREIGVAFQIIDDVLDATSDEGALGKPVRSDEENGKFTYVRFHGLEKSRERAKELSQSACDRLSKLGGNTEFLISLVVEMSARVA